jgi:ribosomal protein S27AE
MSHFAGVSAVKEEGYVKAKRAAGQTDAGGWKPGVGQLLALALGALLVIAAIILGVTTGVGLIVAVPLVVVALVVALFVFRGGRRRRAAAACPHCGAQVSVPSHISEFDCPSCGGRMETRESGVLRDR